jgi:hypothetical protein
MLKRTVFEPFVQEEPDTYLGPNEGQLILTESVRVFPQILRISTHLHLKLGEDYFLPYNLELEIAVHYFCHGILCNPSKKK